jgi:Na+/citrate or Na+/malate symporter
VTTAALNPKQCRCRAVQGGAGDVAPVSAALRLN